MHTLNLLGADNHIRQSGASLEDEDCIRAACVAGVRGTDYAAVVFGIGEVFGAGDAHWFCESYDAAFGGWD